MNCRLSPSRLFVRAVAHPFTSVYDLLHRFPNFVVLCRQMLPQLVPLIFEFTLCLGIDSGHSCREPEIARGLSVQKAGECPYQARLFG